jgi:hypothetical protein
MNQTATSENKEEKTLFDRIQENKLTIIVCLCMILFFYFVIDTREVIKDTREVIKITDPFNPLYGKEYPQRSYDPVSDVENPLILGRNIKRLKSQLRNIK